MYLRADQDEFLEDLYREVFESLWRYAFSYLGDSEMAAEVVQDTFHEAVRKIDTLMNHENPRGWLKKVLKNKLMHARRSHNRYILRFLSLDTDIANGEAVLAAKTPAHTEEDILREACEALPPEEWELLQMIVLEHRPYKVVAEELDVTVWTCQKRVQRIRDKLKQKFPPDFWI